MKKGDEQRLFSLSLSLVRASSFSSATPHLFCANYFAYSKPIISPSTFCSTRPNLSSCELVVGPPWIFFSIKRR